MASPEPTQTRSGGLTMILKPNAKEAVKDYLGSGLVGVLQTVFTASVVAAAVLGCVFVGGVGACLAVGCLALLTGSGLAAGSGSVVMGIAAAGGASAALALGSHRIAQLVQPLRQRFGLNSNPWAKGPNNHFRPSAFASGIAMAALLCTFGLSGLFNSRAFQRDRSSQNIAPVSVTITPRAPTLAPMHK
jgi:hypothetical protein